MTLNEYAWLVKTAKNEDSSTGAVAVNILLAFETTADVTLKES